MKKSVFAIVNTQYQAETIVSDLKMNGFSTSDVSVLFPDRTGTRDFAHAHATKAPEGAAVGGGSGAVLGGTLGLLAGIGALAIPGVGPLIAAGPIMAALGGAAVGGAVGGVTGALVGMGIPEIEARVYEGKIKDGNILISAHCDTSDEADRAKRIFKADGATDISGIGEAKPPR
jgi:hypothetical protein